jgi:hypothetical protein
MALAGPVFITNDERVKTARSGDTIRNVHGPAETIDRQLIKATEDTGLASYGMYVPRLSGTREEAEQIVAMVPATEGRLALDLLRAATRPQAQT